MYKTKHSIRLKHAVSSYKFPNRSYKEPLTLQILREFASKYNIGDCHGQR